jgi:gluconate 2-dehydrogenase gamma chain
MSDRVKGGNTVDGEKQPEHGTMPRRRFLKSMIGTAAFIVVNRALQLDAAFAQQEGLNGLRFFNDVEALTVEAISERIWPSSADSPGARDAGALYYIDGALAGAYAQHQQTYRVGLEALDLAARGQYDSPFRKLGNESQDELLRTIEAGEPIFSDQLGEASEPGRPAGDIGGAEEQHRLGVPDLATFFSLIRTHTLEGMFADPIYGGNRNFAGWRAVGYPGPYYVYSAEEQQSFEPLDKPFQSIADL